MRILFILLCICVSKLAIANETLWIDLETSYQFRTAHSKNHIPHTARKVHLNYNKLKQTLTTSLKGIKKTLDLPDANGELINFQVIPTSVMSSELATRYPEIKTWRIVSTSNPEVTGRIDIGPLGFHGLFHTHNGDRIFIDPQYQQGFPQTEVYTIVSSRANHDSTDSSFTCEVHDEASTASAAKVLESPSDNMRTYRLALAVTGEYTQLFGGAKKYALAGITKTVNRLNQVFERDLNLHLELIAENDKLLFLSPSADPYSNQSASNMAEENIISTDKLIGRENYDIGHVFGTGNTGGLAFLNSACGPSKAGGVTGSNSPEGEAFNIDYVAHEIGHQLGALHTFNGFNKNCSANNRAQDSAVEPGSGSSIMAYAGICGDDNLQANSDAFFHSISIAQIRNFTQAEAGSTCGILTDSINTSPEVDAGKNYTIPAQTPFVLTGNTSDSDGDTLLHSWEQIDTGTRSDIYSDLSDNPLFRIWRPTTSTARYFPRLSNLLNNSPVTGEILPTTNRQLNFSLLVRDNKGGLTTDDLTLNVISTGAPFAITSNAIPMVLEPNQSFNLTWDVADTNKAPINCPLVDIRFINDNADYLSILRNSPNDGNESVTLPLNVESIDDANIKIACSNNVFFAVSNTKHSINGDKPVLSISPSAIIKGINGTNTLVYTMKLSEPASEEIVIHYQATSPSHPNEVFHDEVVIREGETSTIIRVPLEATARSIQVVISKPDNAQFEIEDSQLILQATQAAHTTTSTPEPTPEQETDTPSTGGGSLSLFASLVFFLLTLVRMSTLLALSSRKSL